MRRISTRLAVSFLLVALLPAAPLYLVVHELLERRFAASNAEMLELALDAGLIESRGRLLDLQASLEERAVMLARESWTRRTLLLDEMGAVVPAEATEAFLANTVGLPAAPGEQTIRHGELLIVGRADAAGRPLRVIQPLPAGMVQRAGDLIEGMTRLRTLRANESRVMQSFVGPFLLIYGALLVVALLAGFLWSRRMVGPLEMLVGATRRVAGGDLEFRLDTHGPGEVGELVESFDDMIHRLSDQRRDLARLERASAWRGMARTLAHEVKNPLTPILMAVHQVRDSYQGDDAAYRALLEEVAEIVGEEVESLRRLVREFGDFARLPKCHLEPGNPATLLRDLEKLYGAEVLHLDAADLPTSFIHDGDALHRALVNLLDNGLAACREAGRPPQVTLKARATDRQMTLEVRDAGVGIPTENLPRLFEPDFTTKSGGMGLGLAIVENIVLGHGGTIGVKSMPNEGTTFHITLPRTTGGEQDG